MWCSKSIFKCKLPLHTKKPCSGIKRKEEVKLIASSCAPKDIPNVLKGTAWIQLCQTGEISVCSIVSKWVYKNGVHSNERAVWAHWYVHIHMGRHVYRYKHISVHPDMFIGLCISIKLINEDCAFLHVNTYFCTYTPINLVLRAAS